MRNQPSVSQLAIQTLPCGLFVHGDSYRGQAAAKWLPAFVASVLAVMIRAGVTGTVFTGLGAFQSPANAQPPANVLRTEAGTRVTPAKAAAMVGEDWPQWRGRRGDSTWRHPPLAADWKTAKLATVWTTEIAPGYSGIAVAGERLYTMDRPATPADQERVVCRDARTGELLWQHSYPAKYGKLDYPKGPRATPTVHHGRVYTLGAVGHLFCFDGANGQVVWSKDLVGDQGAQISTWGYSAPPLVDGEQVIVHAGIPGNGCYVAYDCRTGQEKWRGGSDPLGYSPPILIDHNGTRQLIGWTPEHVLSLSPESGRENWRIPYKVTYGVSIATPLFHEGLVVVCGYWEGSKAIRLGERPSDASLAWEENRFLRGLMAPPLYRDRHVYLLDKQHGIVCFELATGKMLWTDKNQLTPRDRNPQASLVWLGDSEEFLALNASGELIRGRLTPDGHTELGRRKIVGETWAHPAFAGDSCFARDDKQLVRVRLVD